MAGEALQAVSVQLGLPASATALNGLDKAALVLLSLDRETAVELLRSLDAEEVGSLLAAAERVRASGRTELDATIHEFEQLFLNGPRFVGSEVEVRNLIAEAMGGVSETPGEPAADKPAEPFWTRVAALSDDVVRECLSGLPLQVAAFVLSNFEPSRAAELLGPVTAEVRNELIERMLRLEKISDDVRLAIESTLEQQLLAVETTSPPHRRIATILNELEAIQSREVVDHLGAAAPEHATAIRKLLFKFEQLPELGKPALAALFDRTPVERIVTALHGVELPFQNAVLGVLAPRARRLVEAELQGPAAASARDIALARRAMSETVLELVAEGKIELEVAHPGAPGDPGGVGGSSRD